MNTRIHTRLELQPVEGKENIYLIGLFKPELDLFLEDKFDKVRLPYDPDGYVRILGDGLNELYIPVVELTTIDLVFFVKTVLSEWKSGVRNYKMLN